MRASEQPPQRQGALPNAHCHLGSCGHLLGGLRALAEAVLEAARHGLEVAHAASALGPAAHGLVLLGVAPHLGGGTVGAAGADALLEVERALTAPAAKGVALRESERRQEAQSSGRSSGSGWPTARRAQCMQSTHRRPDTASAWWHTWRAVAARPRPGARPRCSAEQRADRARLQSPPRSAEGAASRTLSLRVP